MCCKLTISVAPYKSPKSIMCKKNLDIPDSPIIVNKEMPNEICASDDDSYVTLNMEPPDSERERV